MKEHEIMKQKKFTKELIAASTEQVMNIDFVSLQGMEAEIDLPDIDDHPYMRNALMWVANNTPCSMISINDSSSEQVGPNIDIQLSLMCIPSVCRDIREMDNWKYHIIRAITDAYHIHHCTKYTPLEDYVGSTKRVSPWELITNVELDVAPDEMKEGFNRDTFGDNLKYLSNLMKDDKLDNLITYYFADPDVKPRVFAAAVILTCMSIKPDHVIEVERYDYITDRIKAIRELIPRDWVHNADNTWIDPDPDK